MTNVATHKPEVSQFTPKPSSKAPRSDKAMPNHMARWANKRPDGSGRILVRFINESLARSYHWFSAAVPEAINAVPMRVFTIFSTDQDPAWPKK